MRIIFFTLFLNSFLGFSQPGTPVPNPSDTINFLDNWRTYLMSGDYTYEEYQALVDSFTVFDPTDTSLTHKYKNFTRNEWYYDARIGVDENGNFDYGAYERAFKSYLGSDFCGDSEYPVKPWELIGPIGHQQTSPHMGLITAVHMNPNNINEILIGSSTSGIWKTSNKGLNWTAVTDDLGFPVLGVSSFAVSPMNSDLIFASTGISHAFLNMIGIGLLKSIDGGNSWSPVTSLNTGNGLQNILKVVFDRSNPSRMFLITDRADTKRLYKSEDQGNTWNEVPSILPTGVFIDIEILENGRIFLSLENALGYSTIYYSDNGAVTWTSLSLLSNLHFYDWTALSSATPWTNFAPVDVFDNINSPAGGVIPGWSITSISSENALTLEPSSANQTYITIKGGMNFEVDPNVATTFNLVANIPANCTFRFYFIPQIGSGPYTYTPELVYENVNNLSTPSVLNISNLSIDLINSIYKGIRLEIETHSDYINASSDNFWIKFYSINADLPYVAMFNKVDHEENRMLFITENTGYRTVHRTTDGGSTTEFRFGSGLWKVAGGKSRMYVVEFSSNDEKYLSGGVGFFKATAFAPVSAGSCSFCHDDVRALQILPHPDFPGEDIVIVGNDGGISLTEDSGDSWTNINNDLANSQIFSIDVHEKTEMVIGGFMDNGTMTYETGIWTFGGPFLGAGDGSIAYVHKASNTKIISGDPQNNPFTFGSGWIPSISNMDDLNAGDTYLGMPMESSVIAPDVVFYGLGKHGGMNPPSAKLVRYDTSIPTTEPTWCIFDLADIVPDPGVDRVWSIAISESDPNIVYASTSGKFGYNFWISVNSGTNFTSTINTTTVVQPATGGTYSSITMEELISYRKIRDIAVSNSNSDKVWIAIDGVFPDVSTGDPIHERWRVLYSTNGGAGPNWYDYSEGLPGLPVQSYM